MSTPDVDVDVAVIGGSGFYELLDSPELVSVDTPYGPPSGPVAVGELAGVPVAFLPRHGPSHELPPHRVPFRANLWALRSLGVTQVIGPCAAGSLQPHIHPEQLVVLDQLVDRTWGRPDTFAEGPVVHHVSFADPYCAELRASAIAAAGAAVPEVTVHRRGTVVVVQGPRFSTRAESAWFRSMGWDAVNMTQHPEAYLARELGMCFAGIALVTDHDAALDDVPGIEPVTIAEVFRVLGRNVERTRALLAALVPMAAERARAGRTCGCADAALPPGAGGP